MVKEYHSAIEKSLFEFGRMQKEVKQVLRGNEKPIPIVDSHSKKVVNYQPDVYFILKNRWKLIFQVLESELHEQNTIIADVVRACLVENCHGIIFIHPSKKPEDKDRVLEALLTVVRGLNAKGIPLEELPIKNNSYSISRQVSRNRTETMNLLKKLCKEEGWFK